MKPLEPPDRLRLEAAQGWLDLGNHLEANAELEQIAPQSRAHPEVLHVRWYIYAHAKKWSACLDIASALVKLVPEQPEGWIYRASSLTELDRHQEAYETLSPAAALFPADEIIPYDLARVCCALKRPDEARTWLGRAIDLGGDRIKLRALDDPDLEQVWKATGQP